jgi:hypothetical protein
VSLDLYRAFHDDDPRQELEIPVEWPSSFVAFGHALEIVYRSDKWGDGVIDYVHPFEPGTDILAAVRSVEGGPPLSVPAPAEPVAWLGGLVELSLAIGDQELQIVPPSDDGDPRDLSPVMAWLRYPRGRACLLIVARETLELRAPGAEGGWSAIGPGDVLLIAGPHLDVQPEGIVG